MTHNRCDECHLVKANCLIIIQYYTKLLKNKGSPFIYIPHQATYTWYNVANYGRVSESSAEFALR